MRRKYIDGKLHTVRPVSEKRHKVYCENFREYSLLFTENFGKVVQMEVGALLVGKIVNMEKLKFKKGGRKDGLNWEVLQYYCFLQKTL